MSKRVPSRSRITAETPLTKLIATEGNKSEIKNYQWMKQIGEEAAIDYEKCNAIIKIEEQSS